VFKHENLQFVYPELIVLVCYYLSSLPLLPTSQNSAKMTTSLQSKRTKRSTTKKRKAPTITGAPSTKRRFSDDESREEFKKVWSRRKITKSCIP